MKRGKDKKQKKRKEKRARSDSDSDDSEDRRRKLEKKAKKIAKTLAKEQHQQQDDGTSAPTGGQRFIWKKKIEKQLAEGVDTRLLSTEHHRQRQEERMRELEKAQQAREKREAEQARMQEELGHVQKLRALEELAMAQQKEEEFHLRQIRVRAEQRLRANRPKAIDHVAKMLHLRDQYPVPSQPPYQIMQGANGAAGHDAEVAESASQELTLADRRELHRNAEEYAAVDCKDPLHVEFWRAFIQVSEHELKNAERQDAVDRAALRGEKAPDSGADSDISATTLKQIEASIRGQSYGDLAKLYERTQAQVLGGTSQFYMYDKTMVEALKPEMARAKLRELHAKFQAIYEDEQSERAAQEEEEELGTILAGGQGAIPAPEADEAGPSGAGGQGEPVVEGGSSVPGSVPESLPTTIATTPEVAVPDHPSGYSPAPLSPSDLESDENVVDEDEDQRALFQLRAQVRLREGTRYTQAAAVAGAAAAPRDKAYYDLLRDPGRIPSVHPMMRHVTEAAPAAGEAFRSGQDATGSAEDVEFRRLRQVALNSMGSDPNDRDFRGDVPVESNIYWWHDKYQPRKPKYFNRVHTGYEWNKYNQTHYDADNPPPKVVQGYKFNIFYPDLLDPSKTPTYKLEKDADSKDGSTCILRFTAGPPYEDIAFKIVNKEWEYSHKKGFKGVFERGVLHLYFNFKRQRYRR